MRLIRRIASRTPEIVGSPWAFVLALAATVAWLVLGALNSFTGGWVLWPATATSVGAFLLVQDRLDRRDPRLALAPVGPDVLDFT